MDPVMLEMLKKHCEATGKTQVSVIENALIELLRLPEDELARELQVIREQQLALKEREQRLLKNIGKK